MPPLSVPYAEWDVRRNAALLSIIDAVCQREDPDRLFSKLTPHLRSIVPLDVLTFELCDPTRKIMRVHLWEEFQGLRGPLELTLEESCGGRVWRNQAPIYIDELAAENQPNPELKWLQERQQRSYCLLPLTTFHEKLGALGFGTKTARAFDREDLKFLNRVADLVALSVDPAVSDESLTEEVGRLRLLLEVGGPQVRSLDLEQSVAAILRFVQKWAAHDYVGIYLYDEKLQSLRLHASDPILIQKLSPQGVTPIGSTLAGQAFRSERTLVLDYSTLAGLSLPTVKRGMELGVKSLFLSPLQSAKGPLGVLKVARRADDRFSPRDVELLEQVTATIASILEQASSKRRIVSSTETAAQSGEAIFAPASAVDGRHRPTSGPKMSLFVADTASDFFSTPEALMASEQLLTTYFKASKVGLCVLDAEFRYLAVNETLADMNGAPATAHLGKSVREILGDFAELVEPLFRRVFSTGDPLLDLEISSLLPNRTEAGYWIEQYIPIKDAAGNVKQIGVIAVEVTEQKKLEESLRGVSETLKKEKRRQQVLMEVGRLLSTNSDVQKAFPSISAYLRRVLRQEYAALALHEEGTGQLVSKAMDFPLGRSSSVGGEIGAATGAGRRALQERSPLIFTKDEMEGMDPAIAANLTSEGLKSLCCVPLFRPKGPLGVLVLGSTRADAFHTDDLALLNQVAAQLAIALENATTVREIEQLKRRLKQEKHYLEGNPRTQLFEEIIGESPALREVLGQVSIVAPSNATVLILGETGTGKGLVARALHRSSTRKDRRFVSLNCAAIPTGLLESELFGHEKGAFTGAVNQKLGRLELADQGTLFLDEIGDIPLELQPKLLRVLQDHEFERLGGTKTIKVDLRLVAATNRDLAKSVATKQFRSDLFYRLKVFPIRLPSLRERREDIPLLVRYFVRKFSSTLNRHIETIPNETMEALLRWSWPGNVRELENFIERSVILTDGTALRAPLAEFHDDLSGSPDLSLEAAERDAIIRVLRETRGKLSGQAGAARRLGLQRTTLQSKMQRLGITRDDYSS